MLKHQIFKTQPHFRPGYLFAVKSFLIINLLLGAGIVYAQEKISRDHCREEFMILKKTLEELHPDLYRYTSREEFEAKADSISKLLQSDIDPIEFYLRISPLVTQIKNGHTAIRVPQRLCDSLSVLPLRLIAFGGKIYVNKDLGGSEENITGSEIMTINNVHVDEIVQQSLQYVSVDGFNKSARFKAVVEDDLALYYGLIYGGSEQFKIAFVSNKSLPPLEVEMRGITYHQFLEKYDQKEEFPWSLRRLDSSSTALLTIRSFGNIAYNEGKKMYFDKEIDGFFRQIKDWSIKQLVLDIRFNGGGELKNSILLYTYLASTPFQFTKNVEMASITPPTYIHLTNYEKALKFAPINRKHVVKRSEKVFEISGHFSQKLHKPERECFKGKLVVLVNGNTASAAGAFASCVKNDKRGLIVGEENRDNYTGFSAGIPVVLTLPYSGITVSIPIRKFTYATGQDTGRGVAPDYFFASTAKSFFVHDNDVLDFLGDLLKE